MGPNQIHDATQAATTPAARIALALAAVHAARPEAIRTLRLDDVDLGNRRLTIGSVTRPLDELTHRLLIDWLEYRRTLWPNTANPHLIINKQTASTTRAISDNALTAPFRRRTVTLEALRVDRQLDEALRPRPAPPGRRVRTRRDHSNPILRSRATDPPNPSRGTRSTGLSTNPRINSPQIH